jgi:hypothetical protein
MTTITKIDNAKAEMIRKVVQYFQAQTVPVNPEDAFAGLRVSMAQLLEATGVNAADLLPALRDDTLSKALVNIGWQTATNGVGAGVEGFEFCQFTKFALSVEDAIDIVLAGDEPFADEAGDEPLADEDAEDFVRHFERLDAADGIVRNYLLNLTTKWTARDIKLARIHIDRLAEPHKWDCKPRDFIPHIETLSELNEALLRGLEAAAA